MNTPYNFVNWKTFNILKFSKNYIETYDNFKWEIPEYFNIGQEVCDKHAQDENKMNHVAIKHVYDIDNNIYRDFTFKELQLKSNQLANKYIEIGLKQGERIGVFIQQGYECALTHITTMRSGMISLPLSTLFGPESLQYRLFDSGAACVVTEADNIEKLLKVLPLLPNLKKIIVFNGSSLNLSNYKLEYPNIIEEWNDLIGEQYSNQFKPIKTKSKDPAIIMYTSGTTGNAKGCLHGHQLLIGSLPGVQFTVIPQVSTGDQNLINTLKYYTPISYEWIGGLFVVLMPSLFYGITLVTYKMNGFSGIQLSKLLNKFEITNAFLPPSALKLMKLQLLGVSDEKDGVDSIKFNKSIQNVNSGGESVGEQLLDWGKKQFGVDIAELYGQTECNYMVGGCPQIMKIKNGSMGLPIPGHKTCIVNSKSGDILPIDQVGEIAVLLDNGLNDGGHVPVVFLEYWNNKEATIKKKFNNKWLMTGDLGRIDKDGYIWYVGRNDDVINSSGYRIGPNEIELCLLKHPSISNVGIIGVPDSIRGEIVKAYIVLNTSITPCDQLKLDIQNYVKNILSAHEYPREIEFINELPVTTTGKIIRNDLRLLHKSTTNNNKSKL